MKAQKRSRTHAPVHAETEPRPTSESHVAPRRDDSGWPDDRPSTVDSPTRIRASSMLPPSAGRCARSTGRTGIATSSTSVACGRTSLRFSRRVRGECVGIGCDTQPKTWRTSSTARSRRATRASSTFAGHSCSSRIRAPSLRGGRRWPVILAWPSALNAKSPDREDLPGRDAWSGKAWFTSSSLVAWLSCWSLQA